VGLKAHASTGRQVQTQQRTPKAARDATAKAESARLPDKDRRDAKSAGRRVGRYDCNRKSRQGAGATKAKAPDCTAGRPLQLQNQEPARSRRYEGNCEEVGEKFFGCAPFLCQGKQGKPALQRREQRRCGRITRHV